jgi:hypothetical protein
MDNKEAIEIMTEMIGDGSLNNKEILALSHAIEVMKASEWQPIKSAPKIDWEFIAIYDGKKPAIGFWEEESKSWRYWYECCAYAPKAEPLKWKPLQPPKEGE